MSGCNDLPEITFAEAVELSYYGAKVIHRKSIRPTTEMGIPVWIKNPSDRNCRERRLRKFLEIGKPANSCDVDRVIHENGWRTMSSNNFSPSSISVLMPPWDSHHRSGSKLE